MDKVPLGIMPEYIYEELKNNDRVSELLDAIERYAVANEPIPVEWAGELKRRVLHVKGVGNDSGKTESYR